jgi:plastocyanin
MNKVIIAVVIALVAVAAIVGVVTMNNKNNTAKKTSSATSTPPPAPPTGEPASPSPTPSTSGNAVATDKVTIENFNFSPAAITVKKGTTVTWTNNDSANHTVTGDTDGGPKSDSLAQGKTYSFTFNTAGTFAYHCTIHPSMVAKVVVTE